MVIAIRFFTFIIFIVVLISGGLCYDPKISVGSSTNPNILASDPGTDKSQTPYLSGASHTQVIVLPAEDAPISIIREIIHPKSENGYFLNDTLEILVTVTSLKKENLEYVHIIEKPGDKLTIKRCLNPLVANSANDIYNYQETDESSLLKEDITDVEYIIRLLKNNTTQKYPNPYRTNPNSSKLYNYLFTLLSPDTKALLNKTNFTGNNHQLRDKLLYDNEKKALLNDFNSIIKNNHNISQSMLKNFGFSFNEDTIYAFNPNLRDYSESQDGRVGRRTILGYIFPEMINNLSFYKVEDPKSPSYIYVAMQNLEYGESLILKYYLNTSDLGRTDIQSIIKTKGFLHKESTPLNIIGREANYAVDYWSPKKDLMTNETMEFDYFIRYLGGDTENKSINISIINKSGCLVDPKFIPLKIMKDQLKNFSINATYITPAYRVSPPTLSIDGKLYKSEADISVYTPEEMSARRGYERISLDNQEQANNLSKWLLVITFFSILDLFILLLGRDRIWRFLNRIRIRQRKLKDFK
jgi:hypothetical protein